MFFFRLARTAAKRCGAPAGHPVPKYFVYHLAMSPTSGFICDVVVTLATVTTAAAFAKGDASTLAFGARIRPDSHSGCSWSPPVTCAPRFTYNDELHMGCSTADSDDGRAWCSHSQSYSGSWSSCSWKCEALPEGTGTVVMPYANTWVPSGEEVAHLVN